MPSDTDRTEAAQRSEPEASRMEADLKLEKLRFEIIQLRRQSSLSARVAAFMPLLSAGLAILGVWIGLYQFQVQQTAAARRIESDRVQQESESKRLRELELQNPFWQKRLQLYFDASEAAGVIASQATGPERAKAEAAFWRLYLGPLAIVEDDQVEAAMVRLGNCLDGSEQCDKVTLLRRSLALAHSCRQSIGDTWRLGLTELKGKYQEAQ